MRFFTVGQQAEQRPEQHGGDATGPARRCSQRRNSRCEERAAVTAEAGGEQRAAAKVDGCVTQPEPAELKHEQFRSEILDAGPAERRKEPERQSAGAPGDAGGEKGGEEGDDGAEADAGDAEDAPEPEQIPEGPDEAVDESEPKRDLHRSA